MRNRSFIKNLGNWSCFATVVLIAYSLVVGIITLGYLIHLKSWMYINPWVSFTAMPAVFAAWFMSWMTSMLWDTASYDE